MGKLCSAFPLKSCTIRRKHMADSLTQEAFLPASHIKHLKSSLCENCKSVGVEIQNKIHSNFNKGQGQRSGKIQISYSDNIATGDAISYCPNITPYLMRANSPGMSYQREELIKEELVATAADTPTSSLLQTCEQ